MDTIRQSHTPLTVLAQFSTPIILISAFLLICDENKANA
jgi:hypothetical protein